MVPVFTWELRGFFLRPTAYVLLLTMALVAGGSFSWLVTVLSRGGGPALRQGDSPLVQFLGPNVFLVGSITLLVPLLTMNLVADERRRGTWEPLLTTAVTPRAVIAGKFLAGWCLLLACVSPWVYYLLVLRSWNGRGRMLWDVIPWFDGTGLGFDIGPACGGMVGLAVIGMTFTALGLFCSTVCRGPFAAALLSFAAMFALLVLSFVPQALAFWQFPPEPVRLAGMLSCWGQLERFSQGLIDPRIVVGHVSATALLLWMTTRIARRRDE